jgi:5-methylthioadenosine/S-adenosylhomocysteine deaminase
VSWVTGSPADEAAARSIGDSSEAYHQLPPGACDLLIEGGRVLDLDSAAGVADGAAIAIVGREIVAVGPAAEVRARWVPVRRLDATGHVVAPGFVDAHVHLGAYLYGGRPYARSAGPGPFSGASQIEVILPMVARMCGAPVPDDLAAAATRPALAALLRSGVTGVVDAGGPGPGGVVRAATEVGIRAAIGPSLADHWHGSDGRLARQADADRLLGAARDFVDQHDGAAGGRVRALVSAVAPTACSDELLAGIAQLSAARKVPTHAHSHVSAAAVRAHGEAFGRTETERLDAACLLNERCTLMHAGWLTAQDIGTFAGAGVTINYNPVGNAMFGYGVTAAGALQRLLAAQVPVVLGSDYAPATVTSPFDLMRAALMLQRDAAARDDGLTLEQALRMASDGGAALGRPGKLGRVDVGQLADLVLIRVSGLHHLGVDHPVPALALHARADDVATVIVDGRVVVDGGQLVTCDEEALIADARSALERRRVPG